MDAKVLDLEQTDAGGTISAISCRFLPKWKGETIAKFSEAILAWRPKISPQMEGGNSRNIFRKQFWHLCQQQVPQATDAKFAETAPLENLVVYTYLSGSRLRFAVSCFSGFDLISGFRVESIKNVHSSLQCDLDPHRLD